VRGPVNGRVVTAVNPLKAEAVARIEMLEARLRDAHAEIAFLRSQRLEIYLRSRATDHAIAAAMSQIDAAVAELHDSALSCSYSLATSR
jgi:hypothetical protein